jgi:hypothetical protein
MTGRVTGGRPGLILATLMPLDVTGHRDMVGWTSVGRLTFN